jgi:hypothetical protein
VWECENCGQGQHLDPDEGLTEIEIQYAKTNLSDGRHWYPFWMVMGKVTFTQRVTYTSTARRDPMWKNELSFILPAFECTLDQAVDWGTYFLRHPLTLVVGPKIAEASVPIERYDLQALAEFVVITIEAERTDKIQEINFDLALKKPELWIIPFEIKGHDHHLAINR